MVKTARLLLRPYRVEDIEAVYGVINHQDIAKNMQHMNYPFPKEQLPIWFRFMEGNARQQRGYEYGVFTQDGRYIGHIGVVNIDWQALVAELTYFIGRDYWRQGYATEATKAMIAFGFGQLGLVCIKGRCFLHNEASLRVMKKCGLHVEAIGYNEVCKEGCTIHVWHMAIQKVF